MENCGMTRVEVYSILSKQLSTMFTSLEDDDIKIKVVLSNWELLRKELGLFLVFQKEFTDESYSHFKDLIHLTNSCLSSVCSHTNGETYDTVLDEFFFGYFYSLIDTLESYEVWGYLPESKA